MCIFSILMLHIPIHKVVLKNVYPEQYQMVQFEFTPNSFPDLILF